jgi:elongation factor G
VILDASAGVEAQTLTVWQQADNYRIPKLVYLNKMDKARADPTLCLNDLRELTESPLPIQMPLFNLDRRFHGLVDLISMQRKVWDIAADSEGSVQLCTPLTEQDGETWTQATRMREDLIGMLCEHDSTFESIVLQIDRLDKLNERDLLNAIRRCTIGGSIVPVTVGSSYKNVGVQSLMDSVVKVFPSPLEKNSSLYRRFQNSKLCAFAFKVVFHANYGPLTFVRVYCGQLTGNSRIFNSARGLSEKVGKIFVPFADSLQEVSVADVGSIVAISGLTQTFTGDSLMTSRDFSQELTDTLHGKESPLTECERLILHGLKPPAPVFFCSIEAPSMSKQKDMEVALQRLQKEDPSFHVVTNDDTKQMVLNGMGELHIEVSLSFPLCVSI